MEENIQYNLTAIEVLDFSLPADSKQYEAIEPDDIMWNYSTYLNFSPYSPDKIMIKVNYSYFMYLKDDPEQKKLTSITTRSTFVVTKSLSSVAKLYTLLHLDRIASANLIGAYAAKAQKTMWAAMLPQQENTEKHIETLKTEINDRWK